MEKDIQLCPMEENDREQFILDNQEAFNYGAMEEFGCRDNHLEEDGQIISRETIEQSIDHAGGHLYEAAAGIRSSGNGGGFRRAFR